MRNLPEVNYNARLHRLRALAKLTSGDIVYVSSLTNIRYLSGFTGSAGILLVGPDSGTLVTEGRYTEAARVECSSGNIEVVGVESSSLHNKIAKLLRGARRLVLDPQQVSMDDYWRLSECRRHVHMDHRRGLPEQLRLNKDAAEVARIKEACRIALAAFEKAVHLLASEPTERQFANQLEAYMKDFGADDIGFSTIVASGPNSNKPHWHPSSRIIREGEPVVIDFGAVVDGYHSDITRTVWFGKLNANVRPIYDAAVAAHDAGIAAIRPGIGHAEVDAACRRIFSSRGFDNKPLHPSGHNLGMSIHERPYLSAYATEPILEGYVLAVEPGLYIPSLAGCRVEDTIVVRRDTAEILS